MRFYLIWFFLDFKLFFTFYLYNLNHSKLKFEEKINTLFLFIFDFFDYLLLIFLVSFNYIFIFNTFLWKIKNFEKFENAKDFKKIHFFTRKFWGEIHSSDNMIIRFHSARIEFHNHILKSFNSQFKWAQQQKCS